MYLLLLREARCLNSRRSSNPIEASIERLGNLLYITFERLPEADGLFQNARIAFLEKEDLCETRDSLAGKHRSVQGERPATRLAASSHRRPFFCQALFGSIDLIGRLRKSQWLIQNFIWDWRSCR
jgi:hypothetical protein